MNFGGIPINDTYLIQNFISKAVSMRNVQNNGVKIAKNLPTSFSLFTQGARIQK